jgi:hypothetical protein
MCRYTERLFGPVHSAEIKKKKILTQETTASCIQYIPVRKM